MSLQETMSRWRRWLFVRVLFFHDDGAQAGETMLRLRSVGGHMAFTADGSAWCLDDETHEENAPHGLEWYGGGRRDCCWNSERLAPEALAFCRDVSPPHEPEALWEAWKPRGWWEAP